MGRAVAVKVTRERFSARFESEVRAISSLNHPHICTVYDVGPNYLVMELVEGATLATRLKHGPLPIQTVLLYGSQLAAALAEAHGKGIVHRDLKPANIMITGKSQIKVLDFGLAKRTHSATAPFASSDAAVTKQSDEGLIIGTIAYMSPEHAQGQPIDARSDIFSFGVVLYEMLTGRRPFVGDTKLSTLAAIVNQEPTAAKQIVDGLPPELDRVLTRCLRKDPARRFQHMSDLHVALEELREESDSCRLTGSVSVGRPRKRTWLWAAAAALGAVATLGVLQFKRLATPVAQQKVVPVTTYRGFQVEPCFSPDGNQVAFSWDGEKGDNVDIYVKLLGETNALRLTTNPAADAYPAWSPDGKRIAFERFGPKGSVAVYTTSPLGGAEQKLTDFPASGQMSWSPDGKWLAVTSRKTELIGVFLLPIDGGEPRRISNPKAPAFDLAPSISRDGRLLAYAASTGSSYSFDIYVQDLDSAYAPRGSPRRITNGSISFLYSLAWSADGESLIFDGKLASSSRSYLWRLGIRDHRPPQRIELAGPEVLFPSVASAAKQLVFSRSPENYDIWRYRIGGGSEPLIVSSQRDENPQSSPDGTKIAFASNRSGEAMEIWVARADGSGVVQMTNRLGRTQGSPRWSPDGRWIAFDSEGQDGHWNIYVIDANGGRPRRVTSEPFDEHVPSWSRDGKWIYFRSERAGRAEIWRVPFAGGASERLTANGGYGAHESVDGKTLFYIKSDRSPLFSKPVSGGPERQVLPWVVARAFVPVEDGIYYIGQPGDDRKYPLEFFRFSSNTSRLLTKIEGYPGLGLSVSPDRQTILFSRSVTNGANLMMIEGFQ